jgi:hypothetical protein
MQWLQHGSSGSGIFSTIVCADETIERYGLYVFLNPYRAGLITADEKWPHWWCPHPENLSFISELNPAGTPPPEWIGEPAQADLETGE